MPEFCLVLSKSELLDILKERIEKQFKQEFILKNELKIKITHKNNVYPASEKLKTLPDNFCLILNAKTDE